MALFRNKYRIESNRLKGWDYGQPATYYITICTQNRAFYFGDIVHGKMILSEIGKVVEQEWLKTPLIRPDMNITSGKYVVMPNHFHGIISIGINQYNTPALQKTNEIPTDTRNIFGPKRKNLPSVITGFKGSVTQYARVHHLEFDWQHNYWDHIIKGERELCIIEYYIDHNVENWGKDRFNR